MKVLLAQLAPAPGEVDANIDTMEEAVKNHREAEIAVFPELFISGYFDGREAPYALDPAGHQMHRIADIAKEACTSLVFGYSERFEGGIANSVAYVDHDGLLRASYRKAQLFGEGETDAFTAGEELVAVRMNDRLTGLLNCFDVEFPEHARALARSGAELLITVAANMDPYAADHALAVRGRAVENRRPHIYVNRVGSEGDLDFVGESCIVAPSGEIVSQLGRGPELRVVNLGPAEWIDRDVEYLRHVRELPVVPH